MSLFMEEINVNLVTILKVTSQLAEQQPLGPQVVIML